MTVGSNNSERNGMQLLKDSNITFNGGRIYSQKDIFLIQNYSNLTLNDMEIDGKDLACNGNYTISNNN
jgi:hypothetical protein